MATFLPLGTGFYEATNPRLPNDVNITTLISDAVTAGVDTGVAGIIDVADNFADDTAAATGGIAVGGLYHTAGAVKIRVA